MAIPKGSQYEKPYVWHQRMHYMKIMIDTLDRIADIYFHNNRKEAIDALENDLEFLLFKYTQNPKFDPDRKEE